MATPQAVMPLRPSHRGLLRWGGLLLVVGVLLALAGVVGVVVKLGGGLRTDLTAPVQATPIRISRDLPAGTYLVFERTGTTHHVGPVTTSRDSGVTLAPDQVQVTAADGTPIPVGPPTVNETLTRGEATFTGAVRFVISSKGTYTVAVSAPAEQVVVAPSVASSFRRSLAWIGLVLLGGALGVVGVVLLVVRFARRRRVLTMPSRPSGGGWFPDPWKQANLRWWDGYRWTGDTS